jgi:prepilin-type N-terminal cleavage/methylation domain-containing protein
MLMSFRSRQRPARQLRRASAGDTLIEVMLAMAVIAISLASAYSLAGKTIQAGQQSQERSEALKVAEGQVEFIRAAAAKSRPTAFVTSPVFCLTGIDARTNTGQAARPPLDTDNFAQYGTCVAGPDGRYKIGVSYASAPMSGVDQDQFIITVRWDRLGGGRDEVQILYKAHLGI